MSDILTERFKRNNLVDILLKPVTVYSSSFYSYGTENTGDLSLLFQSGYLTIKNKKRVYLQTEYTLGIPNLAVKKALMRHLSNIYAQNPVEQLKTLIDGLHQQICESDAGDLQNRAEKVVFLDIDGVL
jgi:hypothetical protein